MLRSALVLLLILLMLFCWTVAGVMFGHLISIIAGVHAFPEAALGTLGFGYGVLRLHRLIKSMSAPE